ncbi:MAG TPA: SpoVR family protein [Gammaproteobacteria bacterium]|nr:SpoVR family protein [Gammaproteobacteria bacterium]
MTEHEKTLKHKVKKKHLPNSAGSEWTFETLEHYDKIIKDIAIEFKLDTYPNQVELISAEQMMDAYSAVGMPIGYHHWSYGKQFLNVEKNYKRGLMGLAYELVINSDPCISYMMEENTLTLQVMILAHACYGHNSFFKNNYLYKAWTDADSIIDYLVFAKNYIAKCEEQYGIERVEELLDACHSLKNYGVDRYRRPAKLSLAEEKARQTSRAEYLQSQINEIWRTLPSQEPVNAVKHEVRFPEEPEENLLYFLEKNAPLLESWEREIIRIVRKIAQYFYPQRQTKVMNEGWATFWHYTIVNTMYERHLVDDAFMVEFLHNHTEVVYQLPFDNPTYAGINPYNLGFAIFQDIQRICEDPTPEDEQWFPDLVNTDWLTAVDFAMRNYKDESFIAQYLSPKVIRDLKLFVIVNDVTQPEMEVTEIHDEIGYKKIRETLAQQYNISMTEPNIQIYNVDKRGDRSLTLRHILRDARPLDPKDTAEVMRHLYKVWGFNVKLESVDEQGNVVATMQCPEEPKPASPATDQA